MIDRGGFIFDEEACIRLVRVGDYKKAMQVARQVIKRNPKSYMAHHCLAAVYYFWGDFKKALQHAKKMEELAKDKEQLAGSYNWIGVSYHRLGKLDLALAYYNKYLNLSRELGSKKIESIALGNIAGVYKDKGEYDKALEFYTRSLELKEDPREKAVTLNNIGTLYSKLENYEEAVKYLKEAVDISESTGDYHLNGQRMLNLGDVYRKMKQYEEAEKYLREGLKRVQVVGDKYSEFMGYEYFGYYHLDRKEYKEALDNFYKAFLIGMRLNYDRIYLPVLHIAIILTLKPEFTTYVMELTNNDQGFMKLIKEFSQVEDFESLVEQYK